MEFTQFDVSLSEAYFNTEKHKQSTFILICNLLISHKYFNFIFVKHAP